MSEMKSELEQQIQSLENFIKSRPDSRELTRALAVKLALENHAYRAIQQILGVSAGFISKWKNAFIEWGIEGLKLGYKGAASYLSEEQRAEAIAWIISQNFWDISNVEKHLIEQYDVAFKSPQSYYNLLKEARRSVRRGKPETQGQELSKISNNWRSRTSSNLHNKPVTFTHRSTILETQS
jgi:transposase